MNLYLSPMELYDLRSKLTRLQLDGDEDAPKLLNLLDDAEDAAKFKDLVREIKESALDNFSTDGENVVESALEGIMEALNGINVEDSVTDMVGDFNRKFSKLIAQEHVGELGDEFTEWFQREVAELKKNIQAQFKDLTDSQKDLVADLEKLECDE